MTPTKKRKTSSSDAPADRAPKAATLLAQAPAAVRAAITVLANSPVAGPSRQRQPPPEPQPEEPAVEEEEQPPAAAPAAAAAPKPKRKKASKRKTLTTKGKRAVVKNVLATVEAERTAAAAAAVAAAAAATTTATATESTPSPEAIKNLGKAWNKQDLAKLARLAEDKDFLRATIPDHPELTSSNNGNDLDWDLISSHFGRYSKGGVAVKQQYYAVVRLMKEARGEGKKGTSYVDLVKLVLTDLPENKGTVYEIQDVLKKKHAKHLDKYKVKGQVRWKKAVGEVLRQETSVFEAVGKTESGKIIWKLK
jgi:hypothetical protein